MEFIEKVKLFNQIAGHTEQFDSRKVALYTGMLCEEFAEMIHSLNLSSLDAFHEMLVAYGNAFKKGTFDSGMENIDRVEFLDGCIDVAVIATGSAIVSGADVIPAFHHIADNNLSKYETDADGNYIVLRDANGKIMKPASYVRPNLEPFIK